MALIGTAIAGALGAFGNKPKVPKFEQVDTSKEQLSAIAGNAAAMPALNKLATDLNLFSQQQNDKMLENAFGGFYSSIKSQIGKNILSEVSGEIPTDVSEAVRRNSAAKSLYGGFGGTGMSRNLTARDLGLTSLDLTQKGLDSAGRWMASGAKAPQFDLSGFLVSPQTRIQTQMFNSTNQFDRDWLANQVDAAPDPFMRALGQAFINDESSYMQMLGSASGSGGGGGGM